MCPPKILICTVLFENQHLPPNKTSQNLRIKMKLNCEAVAQHETHSGISATANWWNQSPLKAMQLLCGELFCYNSQQSNIVVLRTRVQFCNNSVSNLSNPEYSGNISIPVSCGSLVGLAIWHGPIPCTMYITIICIIIIIFICIIHKRSIIEHHLHRKTHSLLKQTSYIALAFMVCTMLQCNLMQFFATLPLHHLCIAS